jgi:hypothetical protein
VAKFPIKELKDVELKDRMMKSLGKGYITSITFVKDGKEDAYNINCIRKMNVGGVIFYSI